MEKKQEVKKVADKVVTPLELDEMLKDICILTNEEAIVLEGGHVAPIRCRNKGCSNGNCGC